MSGKVWYAPNKLQAYGNDEIEAVVECLRDGWLAGNGPRSEEFQQKVATYFGKQYGLFVNSGSSANLLALLALGLESGDVVTPACTFSTTVAPILQAGLIPIFCDVELGTYVPSIEQVVSCITDKTKVILLPNLIGNKPDWRELRDYIDTLNQKIYLVEDSCDTMTFTCWTDIATTSFYASHIITAGGSGGMVMFNDRSLWETAIRYRDWGRYAFNDSEDIADRFSDSVDGIPYDWKFLYKHIGYNFKSCEINAAFGLVQLSKLESMKKHRRMLIERYLSNLKDTVISLPDDSQKSDWLAIPLRYNQDRKGLLEFLESHNIQTRVCFSGNITKHPAYRKFKQDFLNADCIMGGSFLLGAHTGMSIEDVDEVCRRLKQYCTL